MEPSQTLPAPESRPEKKSDKKADKEKDKKTAAEEKTHPAPKPATFNAIRLLGLNKVTARSAVLEAPLGTVMRMGNIEIIARRCWQAPPDAPPENAALLEVRELKPEGPVPLFSGWMFSSSPGLSSLEHPVYDVTVLACVGTEQTD
ncbi:MAG: DUF2155 domain-containing protein [Alphaproteobacteria bacterium]|nr:DUF2155 domain-containing protein [Alphaproteobacteria bacterium]